MIGCSTNNCFCRADIMQSAMASMSVSVSEACSGGGVQSAMQAVESYCVGNGFAVTGVTSFSAESTGTPAAAVSSFVLPGTFLNLLVNSNQNLYAPFFKALLPTSSHQPPPLLPPPPPPI
jgi:hypothetical protein